MKHLVSAFAFACLSAAFAGTAWADQADGPGAERNALKPETARYQPQCPGCPVQARPFDIGERGARKLGRIPPFFQFSSGGQALGDGAVAANVQVRGGLGAVGADVGFSSFFEESPKGGDFRTLQLWNASVAFNLTGDILTDVQMFMTVGVAGMTTDVDDPRVGVEFGMDVRKPVGEFVLLGAAGGRIMGDNTAIFVGRAAVSFSIFELGYRLTAFENGPKLGGPEVGLFWRY